MLIKIIGTFAVTLILAYPLLGLGGLSFASINKAKDERSWFGKCFFIIQGMLGMIAVAVIPLATAVQNGIAGFIGVGSGIIAIAFYNKKCKWFIKIELVSDN